MKTKTLGSSKNYWWIPLMSGFILFLIGTWFVLAPIENFHSLTIVIGLIVILSGIMEIYVLLRSKKSIKQQLSYLWGGVFNIALGIILIMNPRTILLIISVLIGFWLIFKGGEQIKRAFNLRKNKCQVWKRVLTLGILMIVAAAILLWHPETLGFTIALWTAIAFILIGIFRMYLAFRMRTYL